MKQISKITQETFIYLYKVLTDLGLDQDRISFAELKNILNNDKMFNSEEFAYEVFYVICVAGFKQDYAKIICNKIIYLAQKKPDLNLEDLKCIYNHSGKIKAILKVWQNRDMYQKKFYELHTLEEKLNFLETLPYIGPITKYHLARNLGLNFVKYDIWIQRLGVALYGDINLLNLVNNSKLSPQVEAACNRMFADIHKNTGEKIGFIDAILWRACQKGLIKIDKQYVYLDTNFSIKSKVTKL